MDFSLDPNDRKELEKIAKSDANPCLIKRANMLLLRDDGLTKDEAACELGTARNAVEYWVDKYIAKKPETNIIDFLSTHPERGRKRVVTDEAKAWVISLSHQSPRDFGYDAEKWTSRALTLYIHRHAREAGFEQLSTISRQVIYYILRHDNMKNSK